MMPQGVAMRDMVKPESVQATEQVKAAARQDANEVSVETKVKKQDEEEKTVLSIKKAVEKSNKMAKKLNSQVRFEVDLETKDLIVKVVDKETNEVIRQIPSEEMVRLASHVEELRGLIFNEEG